MNAALITALTASGTALLVTLLQAISRRRDARVVEELKARLSQQHDFSLECLRRYIEYVAAGHTRELDAFQAFLRVVQLLREKVHAARDNPQSLDPRVHAQETEAASRNLVNCFAEHQTDFSPDHWKPAHHLKNECREMATAFCKHLHQLAPGGVVNVPVEIDRHEEEIAAMQADLRHSAGVAATRFADSLKKEASKSVGES